MMNKIIEYNWYGIKDAIIDSKIENMSIDEMAEFVRSYMWEYLEDYSEEELLDEAEVFGVDASEFEVNEVDNG